MPKRPLGVTIIVLLEAIPLAILLLGLLTNPSENAGFIEGAAAQGMAVEQAVKRGWVMAILLGTFVVGAWLGLSSGWWVGGALQIQSLFTLPNAIARFMQTPTPADQWQHGFDLIGGTCLVIGILAYWFRPHVLDYFGIGRIKTWQGLLVLLGIAFMIQLGLMLAPVWG